MRHTHNARTMKVEAEVALGVFALATPAKKSWKNCELFFSAVLFLFLFFTFDYFVYLFVVFASFVCILEFCLHWRACALASSIDFSKYLWISRINLFYLNFFLAFIFLTGLLTRKDFSQIKLFIMENCRWWASGVFFTYFLFNGSYILCFFFYILLFKYCLPLCLYLKTIGC